MTERHGHLPRPLAVGEEPPPLKPTPQRRSDAVSRGADKAKVKPEAGQRFQVLNAFADSTLARLGRAEIAVWLLLWRDTRHGSARTAYDDLAGRAGLNRRNVGRALRRLERLGLVEVIRRGGLRQGPSSYRVRPLVIDG